MLGNLHISDAVSEALTGWQQSLECYILLASLAGEIKALAAGNALRQYDGRSDLITMSVSSRLSLVFLVTALAACGDSGTQPTVDSANTIAKVSVNASRTILNVGGTSQFTADAENSAGKILAGETIKWISSHPDVATITPQGLVTAIAFGTTQITATSGGQTDSVTLTVDGPTQITLVSDSGDYVGRGASYSYTDSNAVISIDATTTGIQLSIAGKQNWNARFQVPTGTQLAPGAYTNATVAPFQGSGAGLSWFGAGRGCLAVAGSFTIDSITWFAGTGSWLVALDMHFEQYCDGDTTALRGTIHWRLDDPTVPPGPTVPIPTNLWQPPTGAVPDTGNFVYLESQQGDSIGQGATNLYQTNITVVGSGARATVSAGGYSGDFAGANSIAQLTVGYYSGLRRYPFNNPVRGGLNWSGNGRGCNDLTGWFAVDSVNYVNGVLAGIKLRFEQHCDGQTPALNGIVRWGRLSG